MWIKNSDNKKDIMLSLAVYSWLVVVISIVFPMLSGFSFGEYTIPEIIAPPSELLLGFLAATFVGYVTRRNKKDQIEHEEWETKNKEKKD